LDAFVIGPMKKFGYNYNMNVIFMCLGHLMVGHFCNQALKNHIKIWIYTVKKYCWFNLKN